MEWKNWSSQQNMAKQEINVQKHTFLYRGLNFWLQQLVVINTKNLDTSVKQFTDRHIHSQTHSCMYKQSQTKERIQKRKRSGKFLHFDCQAASLAKKVTP